MTSVYDFSAQSLSGEPVALDSFRNQVLLIVNTASKCGMTPHYSGLQTLYEKYRERGFAVLGFPCNQFGHQEPGDADAIRSFCDTTYHVTFPMFAKIDVNGAHTHPLYAFLKSAAPGIFNFEDIKWNFTKFLIGRDGQVLDRFAPITTPAAIEKHVIEALG